MQVLFLTLSVSRKAGGLFFSVRSLAKNLIHSGVRCRVIGPHDEFSDQDLAKWNPVEVETYEVQGPATISYSREVTPLVGTPDIQHIHGIWMYHSRVNRQTALGRKIPYLISPRGMLDPWAVRNSRWKKKLAGRLYENAHLRDADCIHALCDSEAESIRAFGLKNPICVIPNAVDVPEPLSGPVVDEVSSAVATDFTVRKKRLLFIGRIHPKKGLSELLEALSRFNVDQRNRWQLTIAGWDQDHQQDLETKALRLGLSGDVDFVGPQFDRNKQQLLRSCDAFVLPSFSEGLPMSVLEAWSYGRAAVITTACNLPDGVHHKASITCRPGVDGIESALRTLFAMKQDELIETGRNGRELVTQKFTWPTVAKQMADVYQWMLGKSSVPETVRFD